MILLNSIWLFALAALSIPVAIHLWNIRPGKTLKVGSIALMNASVQKSTRSLKLNNVLLLLLRCLLLALVAFVLTMPYWQKQINASNIKGWVLMPKGNLKESYQKFKPQIDSLTKAGYEFHYLNKDFMRAELSKALADTTRQKHSLNASYWSLLQRLDGQVPTSLPVYLFTPNSIANFQGEKPQVSLRLHWQTYTVADSTATWIENAWLGSNNEIQVVQGNSKPGGTTYTNYSIQSGNQRSSLFTVKTDNGRLSVSLNNANEFVVDTSTWQFAVYADKNTDAGYVKAALGSIAQFSKHKAVIKQYGDAAQIPAKQSWIFWLSQKPLNKQLAKNAEHVFVYEAGKVKDSNSWINDNSGALSAQRIALYKSVITGNNSGQMIWNDGFGNPVLSLEGSHIYHFYTRFDPAWNDLVWSDSFPKMMLRLMINNSSLINENDRRTMDSKQLLPVVNNDVHTSTGKISERISLDHYIWVLLVLIFIAERWLAHKKASQITGKRVLQNG